MFAGFTHDAVVPIVHLYSLLSVLHMHECAPPIYVWCCFQIGALTNNIVMKHLVHSSQCTCAMYLCLGVAFLGQMVIYVFIFSIENANVFKNNETIAPVYTPTSNV